MYQTFSCFAEILYSLQMQIPIKHHVDSPSSRSFQLQPLHSDLSTWTEHSVHTASLLSHALPLKEYPWQQPIV